MCTSFYMREFGLLISGGCHVELLQIHPIPPAIIPISSSNAPAPHTSTLDTLSYHRSSGLSSVIESSPRLPPPNGGADPPTLLPPYVSRSSRHCYRRPLCRHHCPLSPVHYYLIVDMCCRRLRRHYFISSSAVIVSVILACSFVLACSVILACSTVQPLLSLLLSPPASLSSSPLYHLFDC